ncbi:hypothetical protein ACP6PL_11125 [Dapis sp. BLCC M126]
MQRYFSSLLTPDSSILKFMVVVHSNGRESVGSLRGVGSVGRN